MIRILMLVFKSSLLFENVNQVNILPAPPPPPPKQLA